MDKLIKDLEAISNGIPWRIRIDLRAYIEKLHLINAEDKEKKAANVTK